MVRFIPIVLLLVSPALGKHPYDSVCRVEAGGSGVMVYVEGDKGLVVTNAHVMPDKTETVCYWPAAKAKRKALVVGYHEEVDLCFMVVERPPVVAVKMGIRDSHVIFTGFPWYDRNNLHWQYGNFKSENMVQVFFENQPVPGMSGGAIFDRKDGDLCGITEAQKDGSKIIGVGVCDLALMLTANQYREAETWVPNSEHVKDYEPSDWVYAKPDKRRMTKRYVPSKAPHWKEVRDEDVDPAEPNGVEYRLRRITQ